MYIYLGPDRDLIQGLMLVMLWAGTRSPTLPAGREGDRDMPVAIVYWMELYGTSWRTLPIEDAFMSCAQQCRLDRSLNSSKRFHSCDVSILEAHSANPSTRSHVRVSLCNAATDPHVL